MMTQKDSRLTFEQQSKADGKGNERDDQATRRQQSNHCQEHTPPRSAVSSARRRVARMAPVIPPHMQRDCRDQLAGRAATLAGVLATVGRELAEASVTLAADPAGGPVATLAALRATDAAWLALDLADVLVTTAARGASSGEGQVA